MTNIYRLKKLNTNELEKVVGGSFTDIVRKIGCFLGVCDENCYITIGQKVSPDGSITYYKYRCAKCGRIYYARLVMVDKDNGYYGSISESKYNNAEAGENLLVI